MHRRVVAAAGALDLGGGGGDALQVGGWKEDAMVIVCLLGCGVWVVSKGVRHKMNVVPIPSQKQVLHRYLVSVYLIRKQAYCFRLCFVRVCWS
jgi:hypothetical protein